MKTNPGNPMDLRENLKNSLKKKKKRSMTYRRIKTAY